jgi:prevent-host-death family protein
MPISINSREFNRDTGGAKKAAEKGPVIITDRGRPAHVLMSIAEYRRLTGGGRKIADLLAMPGIEDIALEIPAARDPARPADLS